MNKVLKKALAAVLATATEVLIEAVKKMKDTKRA
jgi:hypothetical protein